MIYLDNNATTPLDSEVFKEMMPYMTTIYGNPSSIHMAGRKSKSAIEKARDQVAKALNTSASEIYFTSGGTESDNMAIRGLACALKDKGNHIISSKIEHPAVLNTLEELKSEGYEITLLDVDKNGFVDLKQLENAITNKTILITIMYANNEIGTIEPIGEICEIAKRHNVLFHTDAVQAVGHINIDLQKLGVDALSLSAHKFYGPKGVGALYLKKGTPFSKITFGGHQERDRRPGTENTAGIVGLGKAIELANVSLNQNNAKIEALRDYFISQITSKLTSVVINGDLKKRISNNINISFENVDGETLLQNLDLIGICVSSGSACSSGSLAPSHVLLALGLDKATAKSSIRVSLNKYNTKEELNFTIDAIVKIVNNLRNIKY